MDFNYNYCYSNIIPDFTGPDIWLYRWYIMKLLIIAITLIIGILMITTVVSADSFTFSGTSVFDAGTKINVETISDACHIQPSANQFGLNGIGRYAGVSSNCMSGTKE